MSRELTPKQVSRGVVYAWTGTIAGVAVAFWKTGTPGHLVFGHLAPVIGLPLIFGSSFAWLCYRYGLRRAIRKYAVSLLLIWVFSRILEWFDR